MGLDEKIRNKVQEIKGRAKKNAGRATNDQWLEAEGRKDEGAGNMKQAGEKVKDTFRR